jgi:hypothetical protein
LEESPSAWLDGAQARQAAKQKEAIRPGHNHLIVELT